MKAPTHIETARLILRQPQMDDAAAMFDRYASDLEVTKFLGWPRHRTVRHTEAFLQFSAHQWERWPAGLYLILSGSDGQLLGSTGLGFQTPHEAVTGYVLAKDAWGKGYATEALTAMIAIASQTAITRLSALCHPDHRPSRHVLEKCGFAPDHTATERVEFPNLAPGVKQEALCYSLILDDGQQRR